MARRNEVGDVRAAGRTFDLSDRDPVDRVGADEQFGRLDSGSHFEDPEIVSLDVDQIVVDELQHQRGLALGLGVAKGHHFTGIVGRP